MAAPLSALRNVRAYLACEFFHAAAFGLTAAIWFFFLTGRVGLGAGQAVLCVTLPGLVGAVFELPTGAWADRFGRKRLFLLGIALNLLALLPFALAAEGFLPYLLAAVATGVGSALTSGNVEAILHDELAELGREKEFARVNAWGSAALFTGKAGGAALGGALYVLRPEFPYWAAAGAMALALGAAAFLRAPKQKLAAATGDAAHIADAVRFILDDRKLLWFLLTLTAVSSLGNVYYFTYQPYFAAAGWDAGAVGLVFCGLSLASAAAGWLGAGTLAKTAPETSLLGLAGLSALSSALFVLPLGRWGVVPALLGGIVGGLVMALGNARVLRDAPPTRKSTLLSAFSLMVTGGYALTAVPLGYVVERIGLEKTYLLALPAAFACLAGAAALRRAKLK